MSKLNINLDLEKLNDFIEVKCGGKEYYFGCWSAEEFDIECTEVPENIQLERGCNWFVLRNGADTTNGLIFPKTEDTDPDLVVFRGYLADETLHTYSDPKKVKKYWSDNVNKKHNGIFSAVTITENGEKLKIITDLFGIGPIFTRKIGKFIFFSTAPGLLSCEDDEPDMEALYMRLIIGSIPGNKSLTKSIELCENASIETYTSNGYTTDKWYDFYQFPKGEKPVNEETLEQSEKYLSLAIQKCLKLQNGQIFLPLSGGFDSRRIFAHLVQKKANFETITVQMPAKTGEDIDATVASKIAKDHHIKYTVLQYPSSNQWIDNTVKRVLSLDALCDSHNWSPPLYQKIGGQLCCIYDGIAGDTFVGDGWRYENFDQDIMNDNFPKVLNQSAFPDVKNILSILSKMHIQQPPGPNRGLFTYVAWHSRRNTSLWSQQQSLPGQLIICPYFDLNYITEMFKYVLKEGDFYRIQGGILKKYWKKLYSYPNTRNIPDGFESLKNQANDYKDLALLNLKKKIRKNKVQKFNISDKLSIIGNILFFAGRFSRIIRNKTYWWASQITEVAFWWQNRPLIFKINKK
ncbi:MAG: hypothetical protein H6912_07310 [Kordiimonadaceae bacterium]|nr:hypothetical protein [Kordiimonadaceae bacterium]